MVACLDHLTVVAPRLDVGSAYVEAALGVPPGAGRAHPGMATHNLLLALGSAPWRMTVRADGSVPLDGAAPLLIQRSSSIHPAAALPHSGLHLRGLRIRHPAPSEVLALFAKIGLAAQPATTVTHGKRCSLVAEIQTPFGLREIGET